MAFNVLAALAINEGDPYVAVSWTCTSNLACGRGWLQCTLPTLPQSQNLCVWALCACVCGWVGGGGGPSGRLKSGGRGTVWTAKPCGLKQRDQNQRMFHWGERGEERVTQGS